MILVAARAAIQQQNYSLFLSLQTPERLRAELSPRRGLKCNLDELSDPAWTTNQFVEAIYKSLTSGKQ